MNSENCIVLCHFEKVRQVGPWSVRIDKPHPGPGMQRHVHVTRSGLNGEYSWNIDGSRHDAGKFPPTEQQIGRAKGIAAEALGVPANTLHLITSIEGSHRVSVYAGGDEDLIGRSIFSVYARKAETVWLLGAERGLILVVAPTWFSLDDD